MPRSRERRGACSRAEEADLRRHACGDRHLGDVGGRLDAEHRDAGRDEVPQQVAVVARDLDHQRRGPEPDALGDRLGVARARGRASCASRTRSRRSVREDRRRRHDFVDLDEQALLADAGMQRVARVVASFELLASQECVGERLLAEVDEGVPKRRPAGPAVGRRRSQRAPRTPAIWRTVRSRALPRRRRAAGTSRPSSRSVSLEIEHRPPADRLAGERRVQAQRASLGDALRGFVLTPARPAAEAGAQPLDDLGDRRGRRSGPKLSAAGAEPGSSSRRLASSR